MDTKQRGSTTGREKETSGMTMAVPIIENRKDEDPLWLSSKYQSRVGKISKSLLVRLHGEIVICRF